MLKIFVTVIAVVACYCTVIDAASTSNLDAKWRQFKIDHGKFYDSAVEDAKRKKLFAASLDFVERHNNDRAATFQVGLNQFSDMTRAEQNYFNGFKPLTPLQISQIPIAKLNVNPAALSTSVDWRNDACMPPVVNQGQCGSCWTFAATTNLEFDSCALHSQCSPVLLSQQHLLDCDHSTQNGQPFNQGCNGGNAYYAWKYLAANGGQNTLASYPYISGTTGQASSTCNNGSGIIGAKVSTTKPTTLIANNDVNTMMAVLDSKKLLAVAIYASTQAFNSYKGPGVFTDKTCGSSTSNHQITAVGYGTDSNGIDYWILRNSWGTNWGINGYILFQRGINLCQVEYQSMFTDAA